MSMEDAFDYGLMNLLDLDFDCDADGNKPPDCEAEVEDREGDIDEEPVYRPPDHAPLG